MQPSFSAHVLAVSAIVENVGRFHPRWGSLDAQSSMTGMPVCGDTMSDRHTPQQKDPDRQQRPPEAEAAAQPDAGDGFALDLGRVAAPGTPPVNPTARQLRRSS